MCLVQTERRRSGNGINNKSKSRGEKLGMGVAHGRTFLPRTMDGMTMDGMMGVSTIRNSLKSEESKNNQASV